MTTRMIENQRRAFLASANDDARRLVHSLANLSDAQRAAILAIIAAKSSTPVDIVMMTGERSDWYEASQVASTGGLRLTAENRWTLGNGCEFIVEELPR